MDLAIPFPSNFWPLIPNPASVFVLHVRISRKVTSNVRKCAFSIGVHRNRNFRIRPEPGPAGTGPSPGREFRPEPELFLVTYQTKGHLMRINMT